MEEKKKKQGEYKNHKTQVFGVPLPDVHLVTEDVKFSAQLLFICLSVGLILLKLSANEEPVSF